MDNNKKTVAIIGANSILSQAIYFRLKEKYNIYQIFNKNTYRVKENTNLLNLETFQSKLWEIDYIFFISAIIDYRETLENVRNTFETNVYLLKNISQNYPKARIIHASSVSLFKEMNGIINEKTEIELLSSYQISKYWGEQIVNQHSGGGVNIRLSSLFGPEMNIKTFLPYVIKSAIENKKIVLFGDGSRMQNYIAAEEAAIYFCAAMDTPTEFPALAVNKKSYSNLEIGEMIQKILKDVEIEFKGEDASGGFTYNNELTRTKLGIYPETDINQQIQDTILWMQKQS